MTLACYLLKLPIEQLEALRAHARETGLSVAEIIRRAVDVYLTRTK